MRKGGGEGFFADGQGVALGFRGGVELGEAAHERIVAGRCGRRGRHGLGQRVDQRVDTGDGDADLLGGFGGRAGEGGDLVLPLAEHGILAAGVVNQKGDHQQRRAKDHAERDGKHLAGRDRVGAAVGDEGGGTEERQVAGDKGQFGEFRGFFGVIHRVSVRDAVFVRRIAPVLKAESGGLLPFGARPAALFLGFGRGGR